MFKQLQILLIAHNPDEQIIIIRQLQQKFDEVHGEQILDAFVFDIAMPEENGYMLLSRVRAWEQEHNRHTPAIALTAYVAEESRLHGLAIGFQQHLAKPVEPDEFVAAVANLAGGLKQNL